MNLSEVVAYLDRELRIAELPDYPMALNGLQVENSGTVTRVAAAVDATHDTIRLAIERDCNLLVVHHGLFWDGLGPVRDRRYRRLKLLLGNDVAVYSAHLPLDVHPQLGNNALLARELGIAVRGTFGDYSGIPIGVWGELAIRREALAARLDDLLGVRVKVIPGGPELMSRVGVVTGSAASLISDAVASGLNAFVTGEGAHHTYFDAMENGINVYYAGHYATETFGVRALAEQLRQQFGLPWEFIDCPTGL
ncbi:MAG: Nif3-like dinuclear metal center hexameric protein [Gemmatimonadota bacterium]